MQKIAKKKWKNKSYIRQVPYLWNIIAYDHGFSYTYVKWWYLQDFFFIIIFLISVFQAAREVEWDKIAQNEK